MFDHFLLKTSSFPLLLDAKICLFVAIKMQGIYFTLSNFKQKFNIKNIKNINIKLKQTEHNILESIGYNIP